jgi:hypothetical protein
VGAPPGRSVLALSGALGAQAEELAGAERRPRTDGVLGSRAGAGAAARDPQAAGHQPPRHLRARGGAHPGRGHARADAAARGGAAAAGPAARRELDQRAAPVTRGAGRLLAATGELAGQAGRGYVRSVQEELQRGPSAALSLWLVRVAGPGTAGLRPSWSAAPRCWGARAPTSRWATIAPPPATPKISIAGERRTITPLDGKVEVDGEEATGPTVLGDGQTLGWAAASMWCGSSAATSRWPSAEAPPGPAGPHGSAGRADAAVGTP